MHKEAILRLILIMIFASCCTGQQVPDSVKATTSTTQEGTSKATTDNSAVNSSSNGVPANLSGTMLACEYTKQPTATTPSMEIACRLADAKTGHKVNMSGLSNYIFGFDDPKVAQVQMTIPSNIVWHVLYDITGDYQTLQNIGTRLQVGLKDVTSGTTYYQVVNTLTGRLNLMLYGTWQTACSAVSGAKNGWSAPPKQYYLIRTDQISAGEITLAEAYYSDSACTKQPEYAYKYTGVLNKLAFDGTNFYTDIEWNSDVLYISTNSALTYISSNWDCSSYNIKFKLNTDINTTTCDNDGSSSFMEYSLYIFNEEAEQISPAYADGNFDGSSPALRESTTDPTYVLQK